MTASGQRDRLRQRFAQRAAGEFPSQLSGTLADVRCERCNVDQRLHLRGSCCNVGDHCATVGVTDQDHRTIDRVDDAGNVTSILSDASQWVSGSDDFYPFACQPFGYAIPAGRIRERSVDENHGGRGRRFCRMHRRDRRGDSGSKNSGYFFDLHEKRSFS